MNDHNFEAMAHELVEMLQAELSVDEDEFILRGTFNGRRFEILIDVDDTYPDLEIKMVVKNELGYIDLYYDEEADDEVEENLDPDFDLHTRVLRDGLYLEDYSRNIINQEKRLTRVSGEFLDTALDLMRSNQVDNIEFDDHLVSLSFLTNLAELPIDSQSVMHIVKTLDQLSAVFES